MKFKRVEEKRYRLIESSDYSFEKYRAKADRMMERNYSEDFEMLKYHKWYLDFEPEYIFLYATDYDTYVVVITGYDKTEEFDTQEEAEKYYDDFFRDDEEDELEENIDSGYILTHCPECSSKNRVFVKFPAFNKPFEDTQYTCDKCGCKALVKDSHKYAEDGTIVEGVEDDYQKKIEEYKDKLIEVNAAIEKLLDKKRKYEESTPEVRKAMDSMADGDYLSNLKSDMADLETKQKSLMHNIEVTSEIMKNGGQLKMQDLQLTDDGLEEGFFQNLRGAVRQLGRRECVTFKSKEAAQRWIQDYIKPEMQDKDYEPMYNKGAFLEPWYVAYSKKDLVDKPAKSSSTTQVPASSQNKNSGDDTPPIDNDIDDREHLRVERARIYASNELEKGKKSENKSLKEAQAEKDYTYSNETMDGVKFSIYEYISGPKAGKVQISSLHPYDDAEYHWAVSKDNGKSFTIYIESPGKYVETFMNDSLTYDKVMARLNELDRAKKIKPRMVHN